METKICSQCGDEKNIDLFTKKSKNRDGHTSECKECHRRTCKRSYNKDINKSRQRSILQYHKHKKEDKYREYKKRYKEKNADKIRAQDKIYKRKHPDKTRETQKKYINSHKDKKREWDRRYRENHAEYVKHKSQEYYLANKAKIAQYKKEYYEKNKEKEQARKHKHYLDNIDNYKEKASQNRIDNRERCNKNRAEYNRTHPQAQLAHNYRTRISAVLSGRSKGGRLNELLGCSVDYWKGYLEKLFDSNMSWQNYGMGIDKWCEDHIKPLKSFDLTIWEEAKKAFNYKNTQPMWWGLNSSKGARYNGIDYRTFKG